MPARRRAGWEHPRPPARPRDQDRDLDVAVALPDLGDDGGSAEADRRCDFRLPGLPAARQQPRDREDEERKRPVWQAGEEGDHARHVRQPLHRQQVIRHVEQRVERGLGTDRVQVAAGAGVQQRERIVQMVVLQVPVVVEPSVQGQQPAQEKADPKPDVPSKPDARQATPHRTGPARRSQCAHEVLGRHCRQVLHAKRARRRRT